MKLPPAQHGEWTATYESGRHILYGHQNAWITTIEHPSGWRIEYHQAEMVAFLFAPDGEGVATRELETRKGAKVADLIMYAQFWIESEGISRGFPGLHPQQH